MPAGIFISLVVALSVGGPRTADPGSPDSPAMTAPNQTAVLRIADDGTLLQDPEQQEQQDEQNQQCNPNGCFRSLRPS